MGIELSMPKLDYISYARYESGDYPTDGLNTLITCKHNYQLKEISGRNGEFIFVVFHPKKGHYDVHVKFEECKRGKCIVVE